MREKEDWLWATTPDIPPLMDGVVPDDEIVLHDKEYKFLSNTWLNKMNYLPSDLFFAGTIPLMQCKIIFDTSLTDISKSSRPLETTFYCLPKTTYDYTLDKYNASSVLFVSIDGIIKKDGKANNYYAVYSIRKGNDRLLLDNYICRELGGFDGFISLEDGQPRTYIVDDIDEKIQFFFSYALWAWYGVQIAMLHPEIKTVFSHPKLRVHEIESSGKKRKRKVKYIRTHYVSISELEAIKKEAVKKSCPAWYVSGHWRHYKNGNTIFIAPYWKGVMRDFKIRMDEARDREVVNPCHI